MPLDFYTQNVPPGTWAPSSLPVPFVLATPRSRDVGADAAAELEVALRTWSEVTCTSFRARYDGERDGLVPGDDGINGIFFHDTTWPAELEAGALAQTIVTLDAGGKIHDADIHVNGVDHRFSLDGAPGTQDLRSVLVHEIGHALGLGHSQDPIATMAPAGSGVRWRSLEGDDKMGVCALYTGTGAARCPTTACPSGLFCVAGVCQRKGDRADVCSPCVRVPSACEAAGDDARCIDIAGNDMGGGRVCGRACASDAECGAGFACRPTSEAGDLQCVSLDGCKSATNACQTDAECTDSICRNGVCVGPAPAVDAGADADVDSGNDAGTKGPPLEARGGCDCRLPEGPFSASPAMVLALFVAACLKRRRR